MKLFLALAFILTSVSAFASGDTGCKNEEHYPIIKKADLKTVADHKSAFIVDVNSDESYAKAHVPGAIHYGSHTKDFAKLLPTDKSSLIVAYCGGPACTAWKKAAEQACNMGYTNVQHFKDGISGWVKN